VLLSGNSGLFGHACAQNLASHNILFALLVNINSLIACTQLFILALPLTHTLYIPVLVTCIAQNQLDIAGFHWNMSISQAAINQGADTHQDVTKNHLMFSAEVGDNVYVIVVSALAYL
jgi:hypothetical protein